MHRLRVARMVLAAAAVSLALGGAGLASANQNYPLKMTDPIESAIQFQEQGGWHLAVVKSGGLFYKGMDVVCGNVMSNADVNNRFVQTPTWLGDPDTANAYAIRSTAKAYMQKQIVVLDQLTAYDPQVATIAEYQALRPLRLLILMDKTNIDNLLAKIQAAMDKKLQTGIGVFIASGAWRDSLEDPGSTDDLLYELSKDRHMVDAYIRAHAADQALGMTDAELKYMFGNLRQKGYGEAAAIRRTARRNRNEALKIVDDLIAMQREKFVVRFATGDQMTWDQQRAILGPERVAQRGLTQANAFNVDGGAYDITYPGTNWTTSIGPGNDQLNRISLMNRDLELMDIVKKYVNVDGYWAPEVPSMWHRNGVFHSEAALIYPAAAVEFTKKCLGPNDVHPAEEPEED